LNIVVCVKQVPDTTAEKKLDADLRLDRKSVENILNPQDEHAVEEALRIKEKSGGTVTALCVGPESAKETLRKAIAMGVEKAVLVTDPALVGSDIIATARVLAAAIKKLPHDLVLCGAESTDARIGVVAASLAEFLGLPQHTLTNKLEFSGDSVSAHRSSEKGHDVVVSKLPAVVGVTKAINEPRYPSLKGIMQAKKVEITVWSAADLGVDKDSVGAAGAYSKVLSYSKPAARGAATMVKDDPDPVARIVDALVAAKIL
jgi:electron transfer flavoprotein beta subunit